MNTRNARESEHDFTLALTGIAELTPEVEDALFEAGCDDATLSLRFGRVYLTFSRTASSLKEAILSAIRDVQRAGLGAHVLRVDGDHWVTQADIARRIDRSRQLVHQYITGVRGPGGFPPPACDLTDGAPLWSWSEVADWLWRNDMIPENTVREAHDVAVINSVLEWEHKRQRDPALTEEVLDLLKSPRA